MKRKLFLYIRLLLLLLLVLTLSGCATSISEIDLHELAQSSDSQEQMPDPKPFLEDYFALLKVRNFGSCYTMLTEGTKEKISLIDFTQRYENIFNAMELTDMNFSFGNLKASSSMANQQVTITYTSAIFGEFTQDVTFKVYYLSDEKTFRLSWTPATIFADLTSSSTVKLRSLRAKRGEILDSTHHTYAINSYAESVYVIPSEIEDMAYTITALSNLLSMEEEKIEDIINSGNAQKYGSEILKVYAPGSIDDSLRSALTALPGIHIDDTSMTPIRYYPGGNFLAHSMGYASPITAEDLENLDPERYDLSSVVGRTGLEAAYEDILTGTKGYSLDIYSSDGQYLSNVVRKNAIDGLDLEITIDYDLQKRAEEGLETLAEEGLAGAVIAMNPQTGEILAISSYPDFDPNLFVLNSDPETLASYVAEDSNSPLYNRAVQGSYTPGSTMKPLIAAMCLEYDVVDEDYCFTGEIYKRQWTPKGYWPYPPITRVSNYEGRVNMSNAITKSDNIYFADVALKAGWDIIEPFLQRLGFSRRIDFDLRVSKPTYNTSGNYENLHLLASTGYGQGEVSVSPLQMACFLSAFANNGNIMKPYLVKATKKTDETGAYVVVDEIQPSVWEEGVISDEAVQKIVPMLHRVVEEGSGKKVQIDGLTICGKTGTAEIGSDKKKEIGWFIGFVEDADYDRLVCITLELPANYKGTIRYDLARELLEP